MKLSDFSVIRVRHQYWAYSKGNRIELKPRTARTLTYSHAVIFFAEDMRLAVKYITSTANIARAKRGLPHPKLASWVVPIEEVTLDNFR